MGLPYWQAAAVLAGGGGFFHGGKNFHLAVRRGVVLRQGAPFFTFYPPQVLGCANFLIGTHCFSV